MPQTGFPNGGILPNDTGSHTYSNLIRTEEEIKLIADDLSKQALKENTLHPTVKIAFANQAEGIVTAVLGLAQYWWQQKTYQGQDGYGSANNPVNPVMSNQTNQIFAQSLGPLSDPFMLYAHYENRNGGGPRDLVGIQNFFFNLGLGSNAFSWDANGNLNINDTYLFTGINDFGASPPEALKTRAFGGDPASITQVIPYLLTGMIGVVFGAAIFGPGAIQKATNQGILGIIGNVFFNGLKPDGDPTEGFDWDLWRNPDGSALTEFGLIEPMKIRKTITPQELYNWNPALFWNAVKNGLIPFSALLLMTDFICNSVEVGSGPISFLPNYAPVSTDIGIDMNNWSYGGGGNYPRPFTSFSQRLVEATYSLGPFAMLDYANPKTGTSIRISGRICLLQLVCEGAPPEYGFIRQNWYAADTNGSGYGNNLLKWQWWEQAIKTKHNLPYGHLPGHPIVTIEIATASYALGDVNNFAPDIGTPEDFTLLLGVVIAAAMMGGI